MLTNKALLFLAALAEENSLDTVEIAALYLLLKNRNNQAECSSSSSSSHQSMEQRPYFGQRDGHIRDALLEKELDWLAKEDRGKRLRVDRQTFHKLLAKLHPYLAQVNYGLKVSAARRLTATLRFLATSSTLQEIKIDTHISPQMLAKIIVETCDCIIEALKDYIKVSIKIHTLFTINVGSVARIYKVTKMGFISQCVFDRVIHQSLNCWI